MHAGNPVGPTAVSANIAPVGRTALSANIIVPVGRDSVSATLSILLRCLIPALALLLLLTSCGMFTGTPHATRPAAGMASMPPAPGYLASVLTSELIRLGKSPSDSTPHAPAGSTNAVFDLACSVVDPDGEPDGEGGGELPPTGITLMWTERLLGDYNLDGQVNAGDLAPLGINWQQAVQYDAATLHGGIAYWPMGSAVDDGGSPYPAPPAPSSGARNWRLARIDAQSDGVLDVKDVTPIAVHWCEQSSGYHVYVKLPGGTEFLLVPEDGSTPHQPTAGEVTLPRTAAFPAGKSSADPTRPVRFSCTYGDEVSALPEGRYEYYLTAYDAATDSDGPASAHVVIDITGGVANQPPVAVLTVSPDFAGAPAIITFDASQSHDPDGSIVEYCWDFDADGEVDWSTADETVPEQSSGGEVDTITPGEAPGAGLPPASVTVTYERTEGYANYLYPRVTVVDDKDGTAMQPVKLGVTGWEIVQALSSSKDEFNPPGDELVIGGDMDFDPASGELVAVGKYSTGYDNGAHPEWVGADLYARQVAPGDWEYETIRAAGEPLPDNFPYYKITGYDLFWDAEGQPMVVLTAPTEGGYTYQVQTYIARRSSDGDWTVSLLYAGSLDTPVNGHRGASPEEILELAPGKLALLEWNLINNPATHPHYFDYQYVIYDNGAITVEPVGWPTEEWPDPTSGGSYYFTAAGEPAIIIGTLDLSEPMAMWQRRRSAPGVWISERLDHGEFNGLGDNVYFVYPQMDAAGRLIIGARFMNGVDDDGVGEFFGYVTIDEGNASFTHLADIPPFNTSQLYKTSWGISVTYDDKPITSGSSDWREYHTLIQPDGRMVTEAPLLIKASFTDFAGFSQFMDGPDGQLYARFYIRGGIYTGADVSLLARRVDPRGAP